MTYKLKKIVRWAVKNLLNERVLCMVSLNIITIVESEIRKCMNVKGVIYEYQIKSGTVCIDLNYPTNAGLLPFVC